MAVATKSTLSVAFLSPGWPAGKVPNGIVSYTSTMVDALRAEGVRSRVISTRPPQEHNDNFVKELAREGRTFTDKVLSRVAPIYASAKSTGNAILHDVRENASNTSILEMEESYGWIRFVAPKSPVPIVARLHGPWFLNGIANGLNEFDESVIKRDQAEKLGLEAAHGVSSPTLDTLNRTRERFGIELPEAQVIYNPVPLVDRANHWKLSQAERGRLLFVGRFDKHKGGDVMLDAFAIIAREYPEARLTFVGPDRGLIEANGKVTKFEDYLRRAVPENVRSRVEYLGFRSHEQIPSLRERAMVTIAPSRYEVFGIATAEAMMMGCPVVAANAGGLGEVVTHGRSGLLANPGDAKDLAAKIGQMLSSPDQAVAMGAEAARDAASRFAPAAVAAQSVAFYERVIERFKRITRFRDAG